MNAYYLDLGIQHKNENLNCPKALFLVILGK